MTRGDGSLFFATRKGVLVLGVALIGSTTPTPTWWAHDCGCAWTAAWLELRGRKYLAPRELLVDPAWSGPLFWLDRSGSKRSGHRPDLVGFVGSTTVAIEVELVGKSRRRLDAILKLHRDWIWAGTTNGVMYVCGDDEGRRRIERAGKRVGLRVRIEMLDTIKAQARAEFERPGPATRRPPRDRDRAEAVSPRAQCPSSTFRLPLPCSSSR